MSVDFPPHATCRPTKVCSHSGPGHAPCYALMGFMGYPKAVEAQARNLHLVRRLETAEQHEVDFVADALYARLPRGTDWLRWNGAGDLTPGAIRVINALTLKHPDLRLWVISRKPEMTKLLADRPSLRLLLSLDRSTPTAIADELRRSLRRFRKAIGRLAYVRVSETDMPPPDVWVVFNKHATGNKHGWRHPKVCHATLPDQPHENACNSCRYCFD